MDLIETKQLEYFVAVAEDLHFGNAARKLFIAQPALSQAIRKFEGQLGVQLFHRTTRKVTLTNSGKELFGRAPDILKNLKSAIAATQQAEQGERGTLELGSTSLTPNHLVPLLASKHRAVHPNVRIRPRMCSSAKQIESIYKYELDVGLVWMSSDKLRFLPEHLAYEELTTHQLVCAIPENHRLCTRSSIEISELRHETFVSYAPVNEGSTLEQALQDACHQAGFSPVIEQESHDAWTLLSIVSAGVGISLLPDVAAQFEVPGVRLVKISDELPALQFVVVWRQDTESPMVAALLETLLSMELDTTHNLDDTA